MVRAVTAAAPAGVMLGASGRWKSPVECRPTTSFFEAGEGLCDCSWPQSAVMNSAALCSPPLRPRPLVLSVVSSSIPGTSPSVIVYSLASLDPIPHRPSLAVLRRRRRICPPCAPRHRLRCRRRRIYCWRPICRRRHRLHRYLGPQMVEEGKYGLFHGSAPA